MCGTADHRAATARTRTANDRSFLARRARFDPEPTSAALNSAPRSRRLDPHTGTHLVMSPLELMQRLAALVPRLRLHLIRFHGVLALNAKLRAQTVP